MDTIQIQGKSYILMEQSELNDHIDKAYDRSVSNQCRNLIHSTHYE